MQADSEGQVTAELLLSVCSQEIEAITRAPDEDAAYECSFSLLRLAQLSPALVDQVHQHPKAVLHDLSQAVLDAQQLIITATPKENAGGYSVKSDVFVRLRPLPTTLHPTHAVVHPRVSQIRSRHIQRLVTIKGTILRTGVVNILESHRLYACTKCHHRFVVEAELELRASVQLPGRCPAEDCSNAAFVHVKEAQMHTEYQEVEVQESTRGPDTGGQGVPVVLLGEHANSFQAGDEVEVVGMVVQRWKPPFPGARCETSLVVQANNIVKLEKEGMHVSQGGDAAAGFEAFWKEHVSRPLAGREVLVRAVAPELHGAMTAKLAILLALLGGVGAGGPESEAGGSGGERGNARGEIHVLLVGDPATGKSQLLRVAARLSQRPVCISGRGATGAGLTATAVKEGGSGAWALEAGALVLADGGTLCLDEVEGLREGELAALHEALEQQSVSLAKAGMVASLPARTSLIASAAPKRRYNPQQSLAENTGLSGPLLSRFDAVLVLRDLPEASWDAAAADHILDRRCAHGTASTSMPEQASDAWDVPRLRAYIAWARKAFRPTPTREAEGLLRWYYAWRRGVGGRASARTTIRLLQGLLRLAQAHAKLMARTMVTEQDAIAAISLAEASVHAEYSLLGGQDALRSAGSADPDDDYAQLEAHILDVMHAGSQGDQEGHAMGGYICQGDEEEGDWGSE